MDGSNLISTLEDVAACRAWVYMYFTVKHDWSGRNLPSLRRSRGNSHLLLSYCRRSFCSSSGHSSGSMMMDGPILYWAGCWEDQQSLLFLFFFTPQQEQQHHPGRRMRQFWSVSETINPGVFFPPHQLLCLFPLEKTWLIRTQRNTTAVRKNTRRGLTLAHSLEIIMLGSIKLLTKQSINKRLRLLH